MDQIVKPKISSVDELAHALKVGIRDLIKTSKVAGGLYKPFDMRKANGKKWRHIDNPAFKLKGIQNKIYKNILHDVLIQLPRNHVGGVPGRSILDNARPYINQEMVLSLDLRDCFPRTKHNKVHEIWRNFFNFDRDSARILTQLTTLERHLPQGAPTSTALSNLATLELFRDIDKYCGRERLNFTLYIDDITISGNSKPVLDCIQPVIRIIQKHGYAIRSSKIQIMPSSQRQKVTSILTNKKTSIDATIINSIRKQIIDISKNGKLKGLSKSVISKAYYVRGVSPKKGEKLLAFAKELLPNNDAVNLKFEKGDEKRKCNGRNCLAS